MTEWMTLRELADASGITESTARRYVRLFDTYLVAEGEGRARRWHSDSIQVLLRAASLYAAGHVTDAIQKQLAGEFSQVMESEPVSPATAVVSLPENLMQVLTLMSRQADEISALREEVTTLHQGQAEALKQLAMQQEQTAAAIEVLEGLKKETEQVDADRQRREAERDGKLTETLRETQALRKELAELKRPWWRRLLRQ